MAKKVKLKVIRLIIEESVRDIVDEILDEKLKSFETKIAEKFDNLNKNFKSEEEFNRLNEENIILKEKLNSLTEDFNNLKDELNQYKTTIKNLEQNLYEKEEEIKEKNKKLEKLEKDFKSLQSYSEKLEKERDNYKEEVINLKEQLDICNSNFEKEKLEKNNLKLEVDSVKSQKEFKLLKALLNNPALEQYREKYNIKNEDLISLFNLNRFLASPRVFVNSYYDYLVEYKKVNQSEMDDREIEFYKAVNEYFNEEIIKDIKKFEEGSFDKSKHRGINNETRGEISDDKIVLIPTHLDAKMRVKLK